MHRACRRKRSRQAGQRERSVHGSSLKRASHAGLARCRRGTRQTGLQALSAPSGRRRVHRRSSRLASGCRPACAGLAPLLRSARRQPLRRQKTTPWPSAAAECTAHGVRAEPPPLRLHAGQAGRPAPGKARPRLPKRLPETSRPLHGAKPASRPASRREPASRPVPSLHPRTACLRQPSAQPATAFSAASSSPASAGSALRGNRCGRRCRLPGPGMPSSGQGA